MENFTFKLKNGKFIIKESYNSVKEAIGDISPADDKAFNPAQNTPKEVNPSKPETKQNKEAQNVVEMLLSYGLEMEEVKQVLQKIKNWGLTGIPKTKIVFDDTLLYRGSQNTADKNQQDTAGQSSGQNQQTLALPPGSKRPNFKLLPGGKAKLALPATTNNPNLTLINVTKAAVDNSNNLSTSRVEKIDMEDTEDERFAKQLTVKTANELFNGDFNALSDAFSKWLSHSQFSQVRNPPKDIIIDMFKKFTEDFKKKQPKQNTLALPKKGDTEREKVKPAYRAPDTRSPDQKAAASDADRTRGRTNKGGLTETFEKVRQVKKTIKHPSLVGWGAR